jgi:hypothetical protein
MFCWKREFFVIYSNTVKEKKKQSHYRPGQDLMLTGGLRLPEFLRNRHLNVVRFSAVHTGCIYPPPPPRKYSWYSFLLRVWVDSRDIVRPEGMYKNTIKMQAAMFKIFLYTMYNTYFQNTDALYFIRTVHFRNGLTHTNECTIGKL